MLTQTELRTLLQDNTYIVKQHISLCTENEKSLPLKVYERNIKALSEFESTDKITLEPLNNEQSTLVNNAGALLVEHGLLVDNQVRHYKNYAFILKCQEFIDNYTQERFIKVLNQINAYKNKGAKINNIYGYISRALDNELKQGANNEH